MKNGRKWLEDKKMAFQISDLRIQIAVILQFYNFTLAQVFRRTTCVNKNQSVSDRNRKVKKIPCSPLLVCGVCS